jgi:hypothetical protein
MKKFISVTTYLFEKIILTWQFIVLGLIIFTAPEIKEKIKNIGTFKAGDFALTFEKKAKDLGIPDSVINKFNFLTEDDIQLFCIKGQDTLNHIGFRLYDWDDYQLKKSYHHLQSLGLVKITFEGVRDGLFYIDANTTPLGNDLYIAMIRAIKLSLG